MQDKKKIRRSVKNKKSKDTTFLVQEIDTLLACLISNLPHKNRKLLKAVLRDRQVAVDGEAVTQFDHPLTPGQRIDVCWDKIAPDARPSEFKILFEDKDLIVIDKPSGLLTVATDKEKRKTAYSLLSAYVKKQDPDNLIFIIHRLDRETSGLLLFAKNEEVKHKIQQNWKTTVSQRTYVGVVEGQVAQQKGTITSWLTESKAFIVYSSKNPKNGHKAVTHYKKLKENARYTLLQINLETGRKHQIRVHMQDINHPIIGDKKYGSTSNPIKRMGLHAQVLAFTHPATGEACRFETAVPNQFLRLFFVKKE